MRFIALVGFFCLLPLLADMTSTKEEAGGRAYARSGLSIPNISSLKRKLLRAQRRSTQKRARETPGTGLPPAAAGTIAPATAPGLLAAPAFEAAPPPLPSPDPRRLRRDLRSAGPGRAVPTAPTTAPLPAVPPLPSALATPGATESPAVKSFPFPPPPSAASQAAAALLSTQEEIEPPVRNPRRLSRRIAVNLPRQGQVSPLLRRGTAVSTAPAAAVVPPPSQIPGEVWPDEFIRKAEAECAILLATHAIDGRAVPTFREGLCGAPAARLLSGITASPRIEFIPAATLTCKMVAGLAMWFREDVQPAARKLLGSEVRKLVNASSYVCRNRYGDTDTRISEHAFANALDVAGFELVDGRKVMVLDGWKDETGGKGPFLRLLHATACKRFGTVLGPDANAAHADHLHLDMAPRRSGSYCR